MNKTVFKVALTFGHYNAKKIAIQTWIFSLPYIDFTLINTSADCSYGVRSCLYWKLTREVEGLKSYEKIIVFQFLFSHCRRRD